MSQNHQINWNIVVPIVVAVIGGIFAVTAAIIGKTPPDFPGIDCPQDYYDYSLKEGEELRYIAQRNNFSLDDWKLILNPRNRKPYNSDEAKELQVNDRVCLPNGWK